MEKLHPTLSRKLATSQFITTLVDQIKHSFRRTPLASFLLVILLVMFPLGYFESLRWPLPPPKATHGILKGLLLIGIALLFVFRSRAAVYIKGRKDLIVVGVLLFSFVLSSIFSLVPDTSLLFLWYPFIGFFYIWAFRYVRLNKTHLLIFIGISVLLIMTTFMFAVFSIFSRYEVDNVYYFLFLDHRANYFLEEIRRAGKYVSLGPYFMLMPLSSIFLVDARASVTRRLTSLLVICVSVLTAVVSNNRIDVLIVAIQLGIILWFIPRKTAVVILLLVLPITYGGLSIAERYFGFNLEERILRPHYERDLETIDMRYTYWQTALYNFREHPLLGTGPNTYNEVSDFPLRRYYDQGATQYTVRPDEGIGIHNIFIERLADTGLVGFFAFIAVLFYYLKADATKLLAGRGENRARYLLFSVSSWSWILYGITDNGYGAQGFVTFFFLRGVLQHL